MSDPFMGVVPINNVHVKEGHNPRTVFDPQELDALGSSVEATTGLVQPLAVELDEGRPGHFWIVDGERRWRILKAAEVKKVPVYESQSENPKLAATAANVMHAKLNPVEEADGIRAAAVLANAKTNKQIADVTGFTKGHVATAMRLLKLPEQIQAHIAAGYVPLDAEASLRKVCRYSVTLADCMCQLVRDEVVEGRDLVNRIGEVAMTVAQSDMEGKPTMIDASRPEPLSRFVSDPDLYAELIGRWEKITDQPGSEPNLSFGTEEFDAARAGKVLIELPAGTDWNDRKVTTSYVTDQAWAADLAVRAIERAEKNAAAAAKEAAAREDERDEGDDDAAAKAKKEEREKRREARKSAEAAHDKNAAIGRSLIVSRGSKNRKENKAAWVEAIAAVLLRDNENLPAAGLGLALEQLQTVQYTTIKSSGEEQKKVTYANPEACRKYLWDRITEARTADQKLELLAEALIAVELVDPEAVPRSRRVFYWLKAGDEVAKVLARPIKAMKALARRA